MKLWFRGLNQFVEQTPALVQNVDKPVAPIPPPIPPQSPKKAIPPISDEAKSWMDLERAEFAKHITDFKAHQERFRLERDQFCSSVIKKTRAALEQHRDD